MCCSGPSAPDTSGQNQAALENAQLSRESLAWYKEKDARDAPMQQRLAEKSIQVADQQLASARTQDALAADYDNYNKTVFRPLEKGIVADAQAYDTPEKRQAAAESSMADVNMSFAKTNEANARTLAASGIDPGSTRAMSVQQGQGVAQATANASAAYTARKGVETVGRAMKMDAASLGRGLASNQATSAQLAINAGNSAVSNTQAPITSANQSTQANGQGWNTAISGNNSAGQIFNGISNIQANANSQDAAWGAIGAIGGGAASAYKWSDEELKTDIEPMSDEEALDATTSTPVKKWKYDAAKMAEKGIEIPSDMEGENVGPMAQDVQKTMGDNVAPGGKKINLVTMNGIAMKSIQALDKKVNRLAKLVEQGVSA